MKNAAFILLFSSVALLSCKRNYTCVCKGTHVQQGVVFTEEKPVKCKKKDLLIECAKKIQEYEGSAYSITYGNSLIISCASK